MANDPLEDTRTHTHTHTRTHTHTLRGYDAEHRGFVQSKCDFVTLVCEHSQLWHTRIWVSEPTRTKNSKQIRNKKRFRSFGFVWKTFETLRTFSKQK